MKYLASAALAVAVAGCSGVSPLPGTAPSSFSNNAGISNPFGAKVCHASAAMKPGVAGFITLPSCFGISGKMQFPKATQTGITITVYESKKPFAVYHKIPKTALILLWVFSDKNLAKGTQVVFDYTRTGSTAPDKVTGPFKPGVKYYAVYQIPTPNDPKPAGGITIAGNAVGHTVVGIPFPGTEVEIGARNYEVFTTDSHAP